MSSDFTFHSDAAKNRQSEGQSDGSIDISENQQPLELLSNGLRARSTGANTISYVQVYGERNSGTSFLSNIIRCNMKFPMNFMGLKKSDATPLGTSQFGYKHWFIKSEIFDNPILDETLFIVIYRNPYTWIRAMMDRPYALSNSIEGHCVQELPDIQLAGHVNGKDTINEFHPETGEKINIFELRRLKIQNMEGVQDIVGNIAFVNMEALLHDPCAMLKAMSRKFKSVFKDELKCDDEPPRVLLREYRAPNVFTPDEVEVVNSQICWDVEAKIGYKINDYFLRNSNELKFVILHGSSAVGKSYSLARLLEKHSDIRGIEMDDCKYWEEYEPNFDIHRINGMFPDMSVESYSELMSIVAQSSAKAMRTTEFLLSQLHEIVNEDSNNIIVATCGALPFPKPKDGLSIYEWLESRLPIKFSHVLIEIPEDVHVSRMKKRGRIHLKEQIFDNKNRRSRSRVSHHEVVSDFDEIEAFVENLRFS